jgi:hypothetical protein
LFESRCAGKNGLGRVAGFWAPFVHLGLLFGLFDEFPNFLYFRGKLSRGPVVLE